MDKTEAIAAFAALSQSARLDAFRLLVQAGDEGMLAGDIARAVDVRQNTMSTNLSVLLRAGLIANHRQGRTVRYVADMEGLKGLLGFLLQTFQEFYQLDSWYKPKLFYLRGSPPDSHIAYLQI